MNRTSSALCAGVLAVALSATGASAITVGKSITSGGYKFTVTSCENEDQQAPCGSAASGTLVAAADGIGFDVVFEPLVLEGVDGVADWTIPPPTPLEIIRLNINFSVEAAGSALTDLVSETLSVYGRIEDENIGQTYISLEEEIIIDGAFRMISADLDEDDMVGDDVASSRSTELFSIAAGQTLSLENRLELWAFDVDDKSELHKISRRFEANPSGISPVPLPAPFLMLIGAISGLGFMSFRGRRAA